MSTDRARAMKRLVVVFVLGLVPWTVVTTAGFVTLVFSFGLIDVSTLHLTTLPEFIRFSRGQLPPFIAAWPIGVALYLCAIASALAGVFGREDRRLTGGFLALTAVSQVPFVLGFARRSGYMAFPLGTVLMVVAAWWIWSSTQPPSE